LGIGSETESSIRVNEGEPFLAIMRTRARLLKPENLQDELSRIDDYTFEDTCPASLVGFSFG
jgi:hypothetical protein